MAPKRKAKAKPDAATVTATFGKSWTFTKTIRGTVMAPTLEEAEAILDRIEDDKVLRRRGVMVTGRGVDVSEGTNGWTTVYGNGWEP